MICLVNYYLHRESCVFLVSADTMYEYGVTIYIICVWFLIQRKSQLHVYEKYFCVIIIICNIFEISVLKKLICLIVTDILLLLVATSTMLMDWRSSSSFTHRSSGTRSDSDRVLRIFGFSDEEV